jgi:hypothetical protein
MMEEEKMNFPKPNGKSTKEKIITLLGQKWPLSAKEIYHSITREQATEITYQAIHKTLNEMLEEKTIEKKDQKYQLNQEWIQQIKKTATQLEEKYKNGKQVDFEHFESEYVEFNDFMSLARFVINEFFINYPNPEKKPLVCYWNHVYGVVGATEKEYSNLKKMFTNPQHYGVCKNNTVLDNYMAKVYKKMGKKSVNGINYPFHNETYVCGDFVCEAFFPIEYNKKVNEFFERIKEVTPEVIQEYGEVQFSPKMKSNLIIYKNKKFAEELRKYAIEAYNKRKEKNK